MNEFNPDRKNAGEGALSDLSARLRKELKAGERVVWVGQPIPDRFLRASWAIYLFAIPWTVFALFWEFLALSPWFSLQSQPEVTGTQTIVAAAFPLFGLPFIAVGFWMLAKPFRAVAEARRTLYALTNRRAIIACFMDKEAVRLESFGYEKMKLTRQEKGDGTGSLFFAFKRTMDSDGDPRIERKGFEHISAVRDVETRILRAIKFFTEKAL